MKQQDVAVLILVVGFAGIISFFVAGKFVNPSDKKEEAEVVSKIESNFNVPGQEYFNENSVNPAVRIEVGPIDNPQPFNNSNN